MRIRLRFEDYIHHAWLEFPGRELRELLCRFLLVLLAMAFQANPTRPQSKSQDLSKLSIDDLMNIQVTSVSKKEQKMSKVAAAIFVITQEDISRSGATNIPDLLRMVPGMDVAQVNGNIWAIDGRGFNGRFSNELLVLLDGRTVYTPTFGGVFWELLDLPLEDIDRIEVIRGPGGSVWGANAVNGVISIITKKAAETTGAMVVAGGGNLEQGFGTLQKGGGLGKASSYRAYTKYFNRTNMQGLNGQKGGDDWHVLRGGFRTDSTLSPEDTLSLQGAVNTGRQGQSEPFLASITSPAPQSIEKEVSLSGGFLQSTWNHAISPRSDTTLQISYDQYRVDDVLREGRKTLDADFQHHFAWGERQDLVWGFDYRYSKSESDGSLFISLNPSELGIQLFSSFIQDEFALIQDRLSVTVGTKLEHNHYTGFNAMPSIHVAWTPSKHHTVWTSVSRAIRTPSEIDASVRLNFGGFPGPGGIPVLVSQFGNPLSKDEGVLSYEAGYRTAVRERLSVDFAAYYNHYTNQQTTEPISSFLETTPSPSHLVLPLTYQNLMHGGTHGFEIAATWKVSGRWTVSPGYAFERIHMHLEPTSLDTTSVGAAEGSSPAHSAQLRSHLSLPRRLSWDTSALFVDRLTNLGVPSYTRLDTGFSWQWTERASFSLVGQNLLKDQHIEFVDATGSSKTTQIGRSGYAKLTWHF